MLFGALFVKIYAVYHLGLCSLCSFIYKCHFIHVTLYIIVQFCVRVLHSRIKKSLCKPHPHSPTPSCAGVCLVSLLVSAGAHCGPVISPVNALGRLSWWNVNSTDGVTSRVTMREGERKPSTVNARSHSEDTDSFFLCVCVCAVPGVGQITDQSAVTHSPGILPLSAPPPPTCLSLSVFDSLHLSLSLCGVCTT